MSERWIADRMHRIDASGIRKVFDLAAKMKDPINLSIGQPHFDTPEVIKQALFKAVNEGRNAYSQTQGIAPLREALQKQVQEELGHADREVFICSGTSGGLMLALTALVNPGDEVIAFDPYFVMYKHLTTLAGGKTVFIDTYPDFRIDVDKVRAAITDRTKVILFNSPSNPTGVVATDEEMRAIAELAREKDIALISDEIYHGLNYDAPVATAAAFSPHAVVVNSFSKYFSMTGWRIGWLVLPEDLVRPVECLAQNMFISAPYISQVVAEAAFNCHPELLDNIARYRRSRDHLLRALPEAGFSNLSPAEGAFYLFADITERSNDSVAFCARMLAEVGIAVTPGVDFDRTRGNRFLRFSYCGPEADMIAAAERLKSWR